MNKIFVLSLVLVLLCSSGCSIATIWGTDGNVTLVFNTMSYARESMNNTAADAPKAKNSLDSRKVPVDIRELDKLAPQPVPR